MAGLTSFVTVLEEEAGSRLQLLLRQAGYAFRPVPHAHFGAKGEGVNVVFYRSGKLVVQGQGASDFRLHRLSEIVGMPAPVLAQRIIGADEAGKGDYFGPLVAAACALGPEEEPFLAEVPLQDSKTLSDRQVREAAEHLRGVLPHEIVAIGPRRYNELYPSFGNLNRLLAWAHARAISALVDRTGCRQVLLDQFCEKGVVVRALGEGAAGIELEVRVRAEENPAVAAASILARDAFLRGLGRLTPLAGRALPKGAGAPVLKTGKALVASRGPGILTQVAKVHFKTTQDLLPRSPSSAPEQEP